MGKTVRARSSKSQVHQPCPITLSKRSAAQLHAYLIQAEKHYKGVRLGVIVSGSRAIEYRLLLEKQSQRFDLIFQCQGITLFIDDYSAKILNGTTLEYIEKEGGFKFNNPHLNEPEIFSHQEG